MSNPILSHILSSLREIALFLTLLAFLHISLPSKRDIRFVCPLHGQIRIKELLAERRDILLLTSAALLLFHYITGEGMLFLCAIILASAAAHERFTQQVSGI